MLQQCFRVVPRARHFRFPKIARKFASRMYRKFLIAFELLASDTRFSFCFMFAKNCRRKQTAFSFYPPRFNSMSAFFYFFIFFYFCIVLYSTFIKDYCALRTFIFFSTVFLPAWKISSFLGFMSSVERFCEIGIKSRIFAEFKVRLAVSKNHACVKRLTSERGKNRACG